MTPKDQSDENYSGAGEKRPDQHDPAIREKISTLANRSPFGILCTQTDGQPYGSMIGFAFSDDLKYAVFATPRATRKYRNLTRCKNVALVVDSREKHPGELMKIDAFTATGRVEEITDGNPDASWAELLVSRQNYLRKFLESSSTALFRIKIIRFFYVSSFQEVREWSP